ncbi:MAG: hypothetical protein ACJATI_004268 [Halioglobus sp.]|jgi:hypothetical protein
MGFFDYFFTNIKNVNQPQIQFGRFSDAYKEEQKYDAWDKSLELFENQDYIESYKQFFDYLNDESAANCKYEDHKDHLTFEFYQGSKKIVGKANHKSITAEAKIAKTESLHIGFLRRLLEDNYQLKYCRYALDIENYITAVFSSSTIDGSPYKLYYAFKELATHTDKKDDILISEFEMLQPINNGHIRKIEDAEVRIKYDYLTFEIDKALESINTTKLNISHYPGAESYIYLDMIYRIDYLIKPEGNIMEIVDNIHNIYFHNKLKTPAQKNRIIRKELQKIREIPYVDFKREIYEVKSTFGISQSSGLTRIQEFISSEIKNMDWYYQNGHDEFALSIPSYIVGYSLFNYSMPAPMRNLFNLYYQIMQSKYFSALGIEGKYRSKEKMVDSKIKKEIKNIISSHNAEYPQLGADIRMLHFQDNCQFAKSFLQMVQGMNFERKDHR